MESLFLIPRYMGSDDDDDGYQQVSTSKLDNSINSFSDDTSLAAKEQKLMLAKLDCSDSAESIRCRSSDICNFVDSETNSQRKKRKKKKLKLEKHLQNDEEKKLYKSKLSNVNDSLNSFVEIDSEIKILNDLDCLNSMKSVGKSLDFVENIISDVTPLKKRRKKMKDIQILQKREENGLQKSNILNLQDSKIINENFCSSVEDITEKNCIEVSDLGIKKNKKQKRKSAEQARISKECKTILSNLENTLIDLKVVKDEKQVAESTKLYDNVHTSDLSNSGSTEEAFCTIGQIQYKKDMEYRQALPDWLSNPTYINMQDEKVAVSELSYLDSDTKKNLIENGINFLFPVQLTIIPWLVLKAHCRRLLYPPSDTCVCAPTGSGKTLAFVLPIVQALKDRVVTAIRALVVLPVRELAIQVYKVFKTYTQHTNLQVVLLTGQKSFLKEQKALVRFKSTKKAISLADIIIGTPGRIRDHVRRTEGFCLKGLRYLVFDEADRMIEEIQQGWLKHINDAVFKDCPSSSLCVCRGIHNRKQSLKRTCALDFQKICEPLQTLLFSATLTRDPEQLHAFSLYKPKLFTASTSNSEKKFMGLCIIPDKLTMLQVICVEGTKPMIICHLIRQYQFKRVLCFTESAERAHKLNLLLEAMGLQVREISSFKQAVQRKIVLKQFASGRVNVLVCSDLLYRGIDIANVDCVISYDVPQSDKIYVHRIGRTARAGKRGTAVTLLSEGEITHFENILKLSGLEIPDTVDIHSEELEPLLRSYQAALSTVNAKLKKGKKKTGTKGQLSRKNKRRN